MGSSCGCVSFHGVFVYIRVLTMLSLISNNNVVLSIINFECFKNTNLIAVLFLSKKNSLEKQTQRESFICWFILQMPFKPELGLGWSLESRTQDIFSPSPTCTGSSSTVSQGHSFAGIQSRESKPDTLNGVLTCVLIMRRKAQHSLCDEPSLAHSLLGILSSKFTPSTSGFLSPAVLHFLLVIYGQHWCHGAKAGGLALLIKKNSNLMQKTCGLCA